MLPINPLPRFAARPLLMIGLAAGATALALWARRQLIHPAPRKAVRVEPVAPVSQTRDFPWGTEPDGRPFEVVEGLVVEES